MPIVRVPASPSSRRSGRRRPERGAILVLTAIALVTLLVMTAFAIDLGRRNQYLAQAQAALDTAVLSAGAYLQAHDADYDGASRAAKEVLRQNLSLDPSTAWIECEATAELTTIAPSDGEIGNRCISFKRIEQAQVKYDVKITLPDIRMPTTFGRIAGIDEVKLSALASSNGSRCDDSSTACAPDDPPDPPTTSPPTTVPYATQCLTQNPLFFIVTWTGWWAVCEQYRPDVDITWLRNEFCSNDGLWTVTYNAIGYQINSEPYLKYWAYASSCIRTGDGPGDFNFDRQQEWLAQVCNSHEADDVYDVTNDQGLYERCRSMFPGLGMVPWNVLHPPTTTASTTTTTVMPGSSVPVSIDING